MSLCTLCTRSIPRVPRALPRLAGAFSSSTPRSEKQYPPRTPLNEGDITESFLKGTGPGGQKINKTSSAVQLIHAPTGIVVKCQATRSRDQNRKLARRLLSDRIEEATLGEDARTRVKAREAVKRKSSAIKKSKRKYRRLAEEKEAGAVGEKAVVHERAHQHPNPNPHPDATEDPKGR